MKNEKVCRNCEYLRQDPHGYFCGNSVGGMFTKLEETCENHKWDGKTSLKPIKKKIR